jgi:hypothetical protein
MMDEIFFLGVVKSIFVELSGVSLQQSAKSKTDS